MKGRKKKSLKNPKFDTEDYLFTNCTESIPLVNIRSAKVFISIIIIAGNC